jgi:hypothetical protein
VVNLDFRHGRYCTEASRRISTGELGAVQSAYRTPSENDPALSDCSRVTGKPYLIESGKGCRQTAQNNTSGTSPMTVRTNECRIVQRLQPARTGARMTPFTSGIVLAVD